MAVSGNITTLSVDHDDVVARQPILVRMIPQGQEDWQPQIDKAIEDALAFYHASTDLDPTRAKATRDADWLRALEYFALAACFEACGKDYAEQRAEFEQKARESLAAIPMQYDHDDDGEIDAGTQEEDMGTIRELRLVR